MADREKVIKGLTFCSMGLCFDGCPYHNVSQNIDECTSQLALEALELLEEQQPVEPRKEDDGSTEPCTCWWYVCGSCGREIDPQDRFCRHCGREVKWNE